MIMNSKYSYSVLTLEFNVVTGFGGPCLHFQKATLKITVIITSIYIVHYEKDLVLLDIYKAYKNNPR